MHDSNSKSWQPEDLARKWHALAERRRNHLKELYETGAWKRYYTEETLRSQMREAVREVEHWGALLGDDAAGTAKRAEGSATNHRAA